MLFARGLTTIKSTNELRKNTHICAISNITYEDQSTNHLILLLCINWYFFCLSYNLENIYINKGTYKGYRIRNSTKKLPLNNNFFIDFFKILY